MKRKELKAIWFKYELSCRRSYSPEYIKKFFKEIGVEFDEKLIYTKDRYREQSDGSPRVDGEDVLKLVCDKFGITRIERYIELASQLMGVGSRRDAVEWSYLGR